LATIVGTETAERLISGSGVKVGHGYVAIFPRAACITWEGRTFEVQVIAPDHHVPWSFEEHRLGRDNQLDSALQLLSES
jgi:C-terminal processing protease CtpA/Prc